MKRQLVTSFVLLLMFMGSYSFGMGRDPFNSYRISMWVQIEEDVEQVYERLREVPDNIKELFSHLPDDGEIQWYHVLGVEPNASQKEIKAATRKLQRKTHSDKRASTSDTDAFNAVQTAMKEGLDKLPFKVFYKKKSAFPNFHFDHSGRMVEEEGEPHEIPPIVLENLLNEEEKESLGQLEGLIWQWKRYYICLSTLIGSGIALYRYLENEKNQNSWIKKNKTVQTLKAYYEKFKKNHPKVAFALPRVTGGISLMALGIYPLFRFKKLLSMGDIVGRFPSAEKWDATGKWEDKIKVFKEKKFSHTERCGNTTYTYYNLSDPLGYMRAYEADEQFAPIRRACKFGGITLLTSMTTAVGGFCLFVVGLGGPDNPPAA